MVFLSSYYISAPLHALGVELAISAHTAGMQDGCNTLDIGGCNTAGIQDGCNTLMQDDGNAWAL